MAIIRVVHLISFLLAWILYYYYYYYYYHYVFIFMLVDLFAPFLLQAWDLQKPVQSNVCYEL